jgi:hydroxymethylpyrimidine/phosphomethylpyrimidine kinase
MNPTPENPDNEAVAEEDAAPPCVLSFNAAEPTGAAGTAADVASIVAMGAHALPVTTALLVRDTAEVFDQHVIDSEVVSEQARSVLEDMPTAAFKVGFLGSAEGVSAVAEVLSDYPDLPVVTHLGH